MKFLRVPLNYLILLFLLHIIKILCFGLIIVNDRNCVRNKFKTFFENEILLIKRHNHFHLQFLTEHPFFVFKRFKS